MRFVFFEQTKVVENLCKILSDRKFSCDTICKSNIDDFVTNSKISYIIGLSGLVCIAMTIAVDLFLCVVVLKSGGKF